MCNATYINKLQTRKTRYFQEKNNKIVAFSKKALYLQRSNHGSVTMTPPTMRLFLWPQTKKYNLTRRVRKQ